MSRTRILVVDDHFELAELLCAALESEGLSATVACTGEEALREAKSQRPDLAIVDLGLPDMLGVELLESLSAFDPPVPAVAMSGIFRGEKYDLDATHRYGALRFFEKPFSTTALVVEIVKILAVLGTPKVEGMPDDDEDEPLPLSVDDTVHLDSSQEKEIFLGAAEVLGDEDAGAYEPKLLNSLPGETAGETSAEESSRSSGDEATDSRLNASDSSGDAERRRRQRQMGFVEDLIAVDSSVISPKLGEGEGEETRDADDLLVDPGLPDLTPPAPASPPPAQRRALARGGELGTSTVPRLMAAFHEAGSNGALEIQRGRVTKVVYLRDGQPIFAASNLAGDRLLGFAVSRGAIRKEDAESALTLAAEGGQRIGEVLVELGVLDRRLLQRLVRDQVRAIIWSTFSWREGRFSIRPQKQGRKEPIALNLPLGSLVLEGTLRAVPLLTLRQDVPDDLMLVPQPAPVVPIHELGLSAERARILISADGSKSVGDLISLFDEDERTVRAVLRALWDLGVLAPKRNSAPESRRIGFVV